MTAPRDASFEDYMVKTMKDPAEAAAYIEAVLEMDDPAALLVALRQVAKAHGIAEVARRADVGDKTLFKALSANGKPVPERLPVEQQFNSELRESLQGLQPYARECKNRTDGCIKWVENSHCFFSRYCCAAAIFKIRRCGAVTMLVPGLKTTFVCIGVQRQYSQLQ